VLRQTVTTVWRTKLGATLLIGFNSTTDQTAYFALPVAQPGCRTRRNPCQVPLQYGPVHAGGMLLRERIVLDNTTPHQPPSGSGVPATRGSQSQVLVSEATLLELAETLSRAKFGRNVTVRERQEFLRLLGCG